MAQLENIKCAVCHEQIEDSTDSLYTSEFGMIHHYCGSGANDDESLANTILANTLLKEGAIHKDYGVTYKPQHFKDGACHWVNIRDIDTDDTWSFFSGTFATLCDSESVITARVDCACGEIENQEIGLIMSVPDVINRGIELGLVNDIGGNK